MRLVLFMSSPSIDPVRYDVARASSICGGTGPQFTIKLSVGHIGVESESAAPAGQKTENLAAPASEK